MDKLIYSFMQLMKNENHILMPREVKCKTKPIEFGSYNSGEGSDILQIVLCIIMIILVPLIVFTIINIVRKYSSCLLYTSNEVRRLCVLFRYI